MSIASTRPRLGVSLGFARRRPAHALAVWWHGTGLDDLLAAGADPRTSAELSLRARRLTTARSRRRVANGLAGALRSAEKGSRGFTAAVRPNNPDVLEASALIASIERRLRAPGPVTAQGMALVRLLLVDGNGPLYQPSYPGALASCLRAAMAALPGAAD